MPPLEIERKFLVVGDGWQGQSEGVPYRQGYLSTDMDRVVRVRLEGTRARLTIKGQPTGAVRAEYEYDVPPDHAREMLDTLCIRPMIQKTRYKVPYQGLTWEIDVFEAENHGLVVAEVELQSADQEVPLPDWVGAEVTDDGRYSNAALVERPYTTWR